LGGVAGGAFASAEEAVSACVRVRGTVEPVPEWVEPYAEARERFRSLYPALESIKEPVAG
jgi:sugar (pentulose or hexulose) kinase